MFEQTIAERRLSKHLKKCPVKGCDSLIHDSIPSLKQHLKIKHPELTEEETAILINKFGVRKSG